jgi:predicted nucleic acid-binding protein
VPLVYVDAVFYIASLLQRDRLHKRAIEASAQLADATFLTCDAVLSEVLAHLASYGPHARRESAGLVRKLRTDRAVTVVRNSDRLFDDALDLYEARSDKGYSHTDCIGMILCRERGMTQVLTHDHHFEQEGFEILL